jgi:polyphosphate kinase 2 (PPK2 family)
VFNTNALWRSWYEDFNRVNVMDCSKESPNDRLDNETLKEMKELNYFNKEVEFGSICNKNWFPINLED